VKRLLDVVSSIAGLLATLPIMAPCMALIWLQDFHSPFYIAKRVGRHGRFFRMVKLRSMVQRADRSGVTSTAAGDPRITPVGAFVRRWKLDELAQLWNVAAGQMSLVGPRPQVPPDAALYTAEERGLLDARPGITDLASIVFADEGEILAGSEDPDARYDAVIRPWKSRLGLLYVRNGSLRLDLRIIALTVLAMLDRPRALRRVRAIVAEVGGDALLQRMAGREEPLIAHPAPGSERA